MAQPSPLPQLFGIIPTGSPCLTIPTSSPSPTSFLFTLPSPSNHPFSHICVFLLPGIVLPPDTAAAVYISLPQNQPPQFKFLGGIGPGKESAIFKVSGLGRGGGGTGGQNGEVDMDAPEDSNPTTTASSDPITLGISLESSSSVSAQMAALQTQSSQAPSTSALVLAPRPSTEIKKGPDTLLLAQRIIKNAFNFLASFSGNINGGVEVVPLKAFEEWWRKFEGRVRSDPGFLERDGD